MNTEKRRRNEEKKEQRKWKRNLWNKWCRCRPGQNNHNFTVITLSPKCKRRVENLISIRSLWHTNKYQCRVKCRRTQSNSQQQQWRMKKIWSFLLRFSFSLTRPHFHPVIIILWFPFTFTFVSTHFTGSFCERFASLRWNIVVPSRLLLNLPPLTLPRDLLEKLQQTRTFYCSPPLTLCSQAKERKFMFFFLFLFYRFPREFPFLFSHCWRILISYLKWNYYVLAEMKTFVNVVMRSQWVVDGGSINMQKLFFSCFSLFRSFFDFIFNFYNIARVALALSLIDWKAHQLFPSPASRPIIISWKMKKFFGKLFFTFCKQRERRKSTASNRHLFMLKWEKKLWISRVEKKMKKI